MAPLPDDEFQGLLKNWKNSVHSSLAQIREAQDELLIKLTDPGQISAAMLVTSAVIGRRELHMTNNTTNIGAAAVAITGGTSHGSITGNLQQNINPEIGKALADIEQLCQKLLTSPHLDADQKQDSIAAVQEVSSELQKAPDQRNVSRIRIAMNMLATTAKLVDGAQHLYDSVAPHIMNFIHHL